MIKVSPTARRHDDRAGDPLDGLVNLFDVGIVLAVAFLIAALSSLNLTGALTRSQQQTRQFRDSIQVPRGDTVRSVPKTAKQTVGRGNRIGAVYRLRDGRLVYVIPSPSPTAGAVTSPPP